MKKLFITPTQTDRSEESLNMYFKDITKFKPLTPEQEVSLNQRIKAGDRAAYEQFVEANTRFVISVAKTYQNRGLSLSDLVSAGNIGLCTAAADFDATKGFRFTSFAVYRIQQAIEQELNNHATHIHVPRRLLLLQSRIASAKAIYESKHNESPTAEWLADYLSVDEKEINEALNAIFSYSAMSAPYSADDESGDTREDSYASDVCADAALEEESDRQNLYFRMSHLLNAREHRILNLLFGLEGCEEKSVAEVALMENLTRERIRQIRDKAFSKLRNAA